MSLKLIYIENSKKIGWLLKSYKIVGIDIIELENKIMTWLHSENNFLRSNQKNLSSKVALAVLSMRKMGY
jgi:hypothetical protein